MNDLPVAVLDQIVRQQAEIDRLKAELEEAYTELAVSIKERIDLGNQLADARAEVERYKSGVETEAVIIHAPYTIGKAVSVLVADNSKVGQRVRVLIMEDRL